MRASWMTVRKPTRGQIHRGEGGMTRETVAGFSQERPTVGHGANKETKCSLSRYVLSGPGGRVAPKKHGLSINQSRPILGQF